jgi:hypothetical protein
MMAQVCESFPLLLHFTYLSTSSSSCVFFLQPRPSLATPIFYLDLALFQVPSLTIHHNYSYLTSAVCITTWRRRPRSRRPSLARRSHQNHRSLRNSPGHLVTVRLCLSSTEDAWTMTRLHSLLTKCSEEKSTHEGSLMGYTKLPSKLNSTRATVHRAQRGKKSKPLGTSSSNG